MEIEIVAGPKEIAAFEDQTQKRQEAKEVYIDKYGNKHLPFPKDHIASRTGGGGGGINVKPTVTNRI